MKTKTMIKIILLVKTVKTIILLILRKRITKIEIKIIKMILTERMIIKNFFYQ